MKLKLEQLRRQRRLSQTKLAEVSGVSKGYISELEHGKYVPTVDVLCKLAKALKCTLNDLVDCDWEVEP